MEFSQSKKLKLDELGIDNPLSSVEEGNNSSRTEEHEVYF